MSKSGKQAIGYLAGIGAGVSYGLNPLFFKGLVSDGATVHSILFFRYAFALVMMSALLVIRRERVAVTWKQIPFLLLMGVLFALSSEGLFQAYRFIPAGLATVIVYLYPVFSAFILILLGQRPSWQSWVAIAGTLAGVALICLPSDYGKLRFAGILFAVASALVYAIYLVMVNNSKKISDVSEHIITLFALAAGCIMFFILSMADSQHTLTYGIHGAKTWLCLFCLGLFPTMISLLCLSVSTRAIGPAKTGILGVFEPITAIIIGVTLFGESMTASVAVGILIAVTSVVFLILAKHRQ